MPLAAPADAPAGEPAVSVVVLSWNTCDVLRRCLQTLYSEPAPYALEVIVVDNASGDGSADMVAAEFPQVRLLRQDTNLMFGRGMTVGARAATGRYLLLLNSDCFITPTTIGRMMAFMETHPDALVAGPRQVRGNGKVEQSVKLAAGLPRAVRHLFCLPTRWSERRLREGDHGQAVPAPWLQGSCLLTRREPILPLGPFDEAFTLGVEDTDLCYRVRQAGYSVWFLPDCEAVHLHAQSRRQLSRVERELPMTEGAVLFCRKHYSLSYRRLLAVLEALIVLRDALGRLLLVILTLGLSARARDSFAALVTRARLITRLWRR
jgi:GT2 family glycosyltransferase